MHYYPSHTQQLLPDFAGHPRCSKVLALFPLSDAKVAGYSIMWTVCLPLTGSKRKIELQTAQKFSRRDAIKSGKKRAVQKRKIVVLC